MLVGYDGAEAALGPAGSISGLDSRDDGFCVALCRDAGRTAGAHAVVESGRACGVRGEAVEESPLLGKLSIAIHWVGQLIEVSVLWVGFTLGGLVVLGMGPATIALCAIMRMWVLGKQPDQPMPSLFWTHYRKEFVRANELFWCLVPIGIFLAWDTHVAIYHVMPTVRWTAVPIMLADVCFASITLYLFPLYVHRNLARLTQYFRLAFLTAVINPGCTFLLLGLLYVWIFVLRGALPVATASVVVYAIVRVAIAGVERVAKLSQTIETHEN